MYAELEVLYLYIIIVINGNLSNILPIL